MAEKSLENPNWKPLEELVGPSGCAHFMWMWRDGEIEFYKHIVTRRYLLLDAAGQCYRRTPTGFQLVDARTEIERVRN